MTLRGTAALAAALLAFMAGPLHAQNTGGVFGPVVNDLHRAYEYRISYDPDVDSFAHRLHYQHSLDSDRMWRVIAQGRKSEGATSHEFDFVQGELFWQITPDEAALQQGLRFDLRYRDGDRPGTAGINWTHQFPLTNGWRGRAILLTAVDFGENRREGLLLQTRAQLARSVGAAGQVGLEMFSGYGSTDDFPSFDDQSHQLGPFFSLEVAEEVSMYGSALFGLSQGAPDTNLAIWVTKTL